MTNTDPLRIDFVSDVVCPWCVIGYYQLESALAATRIKADIHWHPFELNPAMAAEGENLREHLAAKYGTTLEGSIKARARLTALGAELGFAFDYADDMRMYNTFLAHQLIHWAETFGKAHEIKMALFSAFFTARRDVNDVDVLADIAGENGLDQKEAKAALEDGSFIDIVRQAEHSWVSRGITGVPVIVFDQKHLMSGAQGVENFSFILRKVMADQAA